MRVLISSDAILNATEEFLDWRVFGFFFSFVNVMFRALFIGITRTKVLTLNAVLMAMTNVLLDYLLIFGHAGFPKMGIQGAAIASVIAEAVSILFFVVYTRLTVDIRKYALNQIRSFDFGLLKRVLDISVFNKLRHSRWWRAPLAATALAAVLDTTVFWSVAFAGEDLPWITWALGDLGVKLLMAVCLLLPFRLLIGRHAQTNAPV